MLFKDYICFRLGAPSRKVTLAYKDSPASIGLTHGQFFMRFALYEENGLLPGQLADKVGLDRPTTTGLLELLERDRRKRLQLTSHPIRYRKGLSRL